MNDHNYNWLGRLYFWTARKLYQEFAWTYDLVSWLVSFGRWAGWRRAVLPYLQGERILEIGFGTGELLLELTAKGYNVFGLDRSSKMHRITGRKLDRESVQLPRVLGEAQALPFASHSFDTVISTFPAEFIMAYTTLAEVSRLLSLPKASMMQDGGRLVMVGVPAARENTRKKAFLEKLLAINIQDTQDQFLAMVRSAGLKVTLEYPDGLGVDNPVVILTHA